MQMMCEQMAFQISDESKGGPTRQVAGAADGVLSCRESTALCSSQEGSAHPCSPHTVRRRPGGRGILMICYLLNLPMNHREGFLFVPELCLGTVLQRLEVWELRLDPSSATDLGQGSQFPELLTCLSCSLV